MYWNYSLCKYTSKIYILLIISIISLILYYSSIIGIIHKLENNTKFTNDYIDYLKSPITLYLICYLFIYCIILRTVSSIGSRKSRCYAKYKSFRECLNSADTKSNVPLTKLLKFLQQPTIDEKIKKLESNSSTSCHKDAISALVINMLIF